MNIPRIFQNAIFRLLIFALMALKKVRNRAGYYSLFSKPSVQKSSCPKTRILKDSGYISVTCNGQGFPLVLFHGWGFDSRIWAPVLPSLEMQYEVYCVDLPGFGLSPFMEWDAFKTSLLSQLPEQFALAGWSLGGLVATRLAIELPQKVTHLVNIASSPYFVEAFAWPGISEATLLAFGDRLANDSEAVLREFVSLQLPGQKEGVCSLTTLQGLQAGLDSLLTWDFRDKLSFIACPVLYLFGSRDEIVTIKTMKVMQERYPELNYVLLSKAAHALFLTHKDASIKAIHDFLSVDN